MREAIPCINPNHPPASSAGERSGAPYTRPGDRTARASPAHTAVRYTGPIVDLMTETVTEIGAPCTPAEGEPATAWALFEQYAALAPGRRNLQVLAAATGHSPGYLRNLSSRWNWTARAADCDAVEEVRIATEGRRVRALILDQVAELGPTARAEQLLKAAAALGKITAQTAPRRHAQPRGAGGRFTVDTPEGGRPA